MSWFKRDRGAEQASTAPEPVGGAQSAGSRVVVDGSVISWPLEDRVAGLEAVRARKGSANFVHIDFPDDGTEHNAIERARKDPAAREALVGLAREEFYLYKHAGSRSSFVSRRRLPQLWQPVKEGRIKDSASGTLYELEPALNPAGPPKLLVVFPAMGAPIYAPSLFRYATRNYKSIQKFVSPSTTVMRLVDLGGVVGNFYLDTAVLPTNAASIQATIRAVMDELGVAQEDVVLLGSSKGATGAVFHGLSMGLKHVAVDPVLHEEHYWEKHNDSHFTRETTFDLTKQEIFAELIKGLEAEGRMDEALSKQVLITSERSPQYEYIAPLLIDGRSTNVVLVNTNEGIKDHPDVPVFSHHVASSTTDLLLSGVPLVAGRREID